MSAGEKEQPLTPEPLFKIATGFMAAKHLFVANELGLFVELGAGPGSLETLAARLGVPERTLRISADAMVALGLLTREGQLYRNSALTQAFLSGRGEPDMRPFLRFWNRISYPNWIELEASLRSGEAGGKGKVPTPEEDRILSDGIEAINAGGASKLPAIYDFGRHRRLLNLGAWYVSFVLPVLRQNASLEATLMMLPQWLGKAEAAVAREPELAKRMRVIEGDHLYDDLPQGHDVFLTTNLAHHLSPEHNRQLLTNVRRCAAPGARLLIVDFFTDSTRTQPPFAALMAGEFQVLSGEGDVYSADQMKEWLVACGWRTVEHVPLNGPSALIVGEAV